MLKIFSKIKKDDSESKDFSAAEIASGEIRIEKKINYFHKKVICEDGKLYNTETATKVIESDKEKTNWIGSCQERTYFVTDKGNWFSCKTFIEPGRREYMKKVGGIDVKVEEADVTYMDLRLESTKKVKSILGATDITIYKKYFGEVEEG